MQFLHAVSSRYSTNSVKPPKRQFVRYFPIHRSWGDGGGGHWLVRMEWRPARWSVSASVNLSLHHKVQKSLLAPAHPGGPGKGP